MNPQTPEQDRNQQFTVNDTTQPAPEATVPVAEPASEADAAALQQIDALESESQVTAEPEAPASALPAQPAISPVLPNPESAPTVVSSDAPVAPAQPAETPVDQPVQPAVSPVPQASASFPAQPAPAKKKSLLIVGIVVAVVVVGVAAGYFVWQAMGK